jgi:hypothetical protein
MLRLAGAEAHDAITYDLTGEIQRATGVTDAQAITKNGLAPWKRVTLLLDRRHVRQVDSHQSPDVDFRYAAERLGARHQAFPALVTRACVARANFRSSQACVCRRASAVDRPGGR